MQKHTKVYFSYFKLTIADFVQCEIPGCGKEAKDIHHIKARGMGGSKTKDTIENLMALWREHHEEYGDKNQYRDYLNKIHKNHVTKISP